MAINASNSSEKPDSQKPGEQKDPILRVFTIDLDVLRNLLRPVLYGFLNVQIAGTEHVPEEGPGIIVSGYTGPLDAVLTAVYFPRPVTFLADTELFTLKHRLQTFYDEVGTITGLPAFWRMGRPFVDMLTFMVGDGLKTQMLQWQALPIPPDTDETLQKERVAQLLREGKTVAIFAEGKTPGAASARRDFAARMALEARCPVYPLLIEGTAHALEAGRVFSGNLFSRKINFTIGKALVPAAFPAAGGDTQKMVELGQQIRAAIDDLRETADGP